MNKSPHRNQPGDANRRVWLTKGGRRCVAVREPGQPWQLQHGPITLIGRPFAHMRDLRQAASVAGCKR
jgi:hypothetical protein